MFFRRLSSYSNTLRSVLVLSAGRNSLLTTPQRYTVSRIISTSNIRLNSTTNFTRKDLTSLDIKDRPQSKKRRDNKRNKKRNAFEVKDLGEKPVSSPWYHQLCAFDDSISQSLMDDAFRKPWFNDTISRNNKGERTSPKQDANLSLFWDSITKSIHIYNELVGKCEDLTPQRVSALLNLIHNALRINRFQLIKLNKKPDYDSKSFHQEMVTYLTTTLHSIGEDILNHKVSVSDYGLMHLLTSLKELNLTEELVQFWDLAIKDEQLMPVIKGYKSLGVMLPVLYQYGQTLPPQSNRPIENYSFETLKKLFEEADVSSSSSNPSSSSSFIHPILLCGMIKTSLLANEPQYALNLYDMLLSPNINGKGLFKMSYQSYLVDAHLQFIGESRDITVAETFWRKAINNEMPYKINLQVSYINSFMNNIWNETHDWDKTKHVWLQMVKHYTKLHLNPGIFSSLNNAFMDIFFTKKYLDNKSEGFQELNKLLTEYQEFRSLDEILLNIVLTKSSLSWNDKEVYDHIKQMYSLYHIPETIVTKRILLKTLGSLDGVRITNDDIWKQWVDLLSKLDSMGNTYIANADWAALRDATLSFENPPWTKERAELYVKCVKLFEPYCRDSIQREKISKFIVEKYPALKPFWEEGLFQSIDVSGLELPKLTNFPPQL